MLFVHKVVLWVMQRRGYLVRLNKRQNFFFTRYCFVVKPTLTSEVIFFNAIVGVATSKNACELPE